jgi:hypothetical protein
MIGVSCLAEYSTSKNLGMLWVVWLAILFYSKGLGYAAGWLLYRIIVLIAL